jgi:putative Ca2+/H+ antiporter (TMEM165/GDT1 family)
MLFNLFKSEAKPKIRSSPNSTKSQAARRHVRDRQALAAFQTMLTVFALTYAAVFAAEIVGDKLLYTTGVLAARYRAIPIIFGATSAFMVKMGAAALVGKAVSGLPPALVASISTAGFLWVAYALWRKPPAESPGGPRKASSGALTSFVAILFSEWGDIGQVTAATMAARFASPFAVWLGAVCAMTTKGVLAAWLGAGVRRWIRDRVSPRWIRYASVSLLMLLGALSIAESLLVKP